MFLALKKHLTSMTESARLTHLLLDIVDRLKHRGTSTKVLWINFSKGAPVPRTVFDQLVSTFGLPFRSGDLDIIWANIGVKGSSMGYPDFVHFISMDKIDPAIGAPREPVPLNEPSVDPFELSAYEDDLPPLSSIPRRTASLSDVLTQHKKQIGNDLLDLDPQFTGFVSAFDFEIIVQRADLVDSAEVQRLVSSYDT
jgi:hypothetical protein